MAIDRTMLNQTQGGGNKNMAKAKKDAKRLGPAEIATPVPENTGPEDMTEGTRKPFDPKTGDDRAGSNPLSNPDWEDVLRARLGDDVVDSLKETRASA
jgi:hypothetical protein